MKLDAAHLDWSSMVREQHVLDIEGDQLPREDPPGAPFDAILFRGVLGGERLRATLERATRLLAPGGVVLAAVRLRAVVPNVDLAGRFDPAALLAYVDQVAEDRTAELRLQLVREQAETRRVAHLLARADERLLKTTTKLDARVAYQKAKTEGLKKERLALKRELGNASRRAARLPPMLPPPSGAGPVTRVLSATLGSMQREVHTGRAFRRPHTALLRTITRARKAFRGEPLVKPLDVPPPRAVVAASVPRAASIEASLPQDDLAPTPEHGFRPFIPLVTPNGVPVTVATILDEFSESCFRYEANLVPLSLRGWQAEMELHRPAFLFAESAWVGNGGQWQYLMTKYRAREVNPLRDLLAWCKAQGITRVFWNKEDPSNFEVFKDVAADFDIVFTTDEGCIPRYRDLVGHDRVYALPFGAQPVLHNPMQDGVPRLGSVCFGGSWRARKYPDRATDTEILLGPALEHGLDIFDRYAGTRHAAEMAFPEPYAAAVRGSLDYPSMLSAYRGYKAFLNVNSVKDSPTMFSRRVFELMACGTPVVSSDSVGIRSMLGSLVKVATTQEETRRHLERLLADGDYRGRFAHAGYREVLTHHTYGHRFRRILDAAGVEAPPPATPLVTLMCGTNRPSHLTNLLASLRRQIYPNLEIILLLNSDAFDVAAVEAQAADLPHLQIHKLPQSHTLAECLNHGLSRASGTWVAKIDDDDLYGAHYISDMMLATRYTDAAVLGKRSHFVWLEGTKRLVLRFPNDAHRHVNYVMGATLFVRRETFDQVKFSPVRKGTDSVFQRDCEARGLRIYATDPYNLIVMRQAEGGSHTWDVTDEKIMERARVVADELDAGLVMV